MILYSVTVNIEYSAHEEWLNWMKTVHIPDVMNTGLFTENRILRLLGDEDSGGVTYSIQYTCPDLPSYERYQNEYAPKLQEEHLNKYKDRFVAFRTLLEFV